MNEQIKKKYNLLFADSQKDPKILDTLVIYFFSFPGTTAIFDHPLRDQEYVRILVNHHLMSAIEFHWHQKYHFPSPYKDENEFWDRVWWITDKEHFDTDKDWVISCVFQELTQVTLQLSENLVPEFQQQLGFLWKVMKYFNSSEFLRDYLIKTSAGFSMKEWIIPFLPLWQIFKPTNHPQSQLWTLLNPLVEIGLAYWVASINTVGLIWKTSLLINPFLLTSFLQEDYSSLYPNSIERELDALKIILSNPRNIFHFQEGDSIDPHEQNYATITPSPLWIPDSVRREIWLRDQGQCSCGSQHHLYYRILNPGDPLNASNIRISCTPCYYREHGHEIPPEFNIIPMKSRLTPQVKESVKQKYHSHCAKCGRPKPRNRLLHTDHIIPFSIGGSDHELNLELYCDYCNEQKSNYIDM